MCPWREPARDLASFFPPGSTYRTNLVILSDQLLPLKARLGRWPTVDENPIYVHRVSLNRRAEGSVLARRIKGEYGVIEVVLAVDARNRVRGVRLQRLREPPGAAQVLASPKWLARFQGRNSRDNWKRFPLNVPREARLSAASIVEGVRASLILLDASAVGKNESLLSGTTARKD